MAIAAGLHHHPPLHLSRTPRRAAPLFKPRHSFPCAPLLLRCPAVRRAAAGTPPFAAGDHDHRALPDPEPGSKSPLDLAQLIAAATAATATVVVAAASPRAALAASGGSLGGCSDDSSSSFSSSYSDDSYDTSDYSSSWWWSSSSSSSSSTTAEGAGASETTHVSVSTASELSPGMNRSSDMVVWGYIAMICGLVAIGFYSRLQDILPGTTVVKLQVALRGVDAAKSFQKDMNETAEKVEASNRLWYRFILTETIRTLWRHKYYVISSSLFAHVTNSWKEHFNKISIQERSKFDEETLSNLDGIKTKRNYSKRTDGSRNEYIVLTILVAAQGALEFPEVRNSAALEQVVTTLNYIPAGEIREEDDVLSEEEMREDYPYLKLLRS